MKIINLTNNNGVYTCNVYLVLGTWNRMQDANTLVDVGRDPHVFDVIQSAPTGVGKKRVEQVILTHSHYDHAANLPLIRKTFHPVVYAFSNALKGVDRVLKGGEALQMGDRMFEVIHSPGHSHDSICLYCEEDKVLFAGDTSLNIQTVGGTYEEGYIHALEMLRRRDIQAIYFGHGQPLLKNCNSVLRNTLRNVRASIAKRNPRN
jgi:glyoxylase-like metal-dependent hydrolase (beta-lactamase superfamily II)